MEACTSIPHTSTLLHLSQALETCPPAAQPLVSTSLLLQLILLPAYILYNPETSLRWLSLLHWFRPLILLAVRIWMHLLTNKVKEYLPKQPSPIVPTTNGSEPEDEETEPWELSDTSQSSLTSNSTFDFDLYHRVHSYSQEDDRSKSFASWQRDYCLCWLVAWLFFIYLSILAIVCKNE